MKQGIALSASGLSKVLLGLCAFSGAVALQAQTSTVVEYYNTTLKHYFIAADAAEVTAIDSGAAGAGWVKTGETFAVWRSAASAPAGSQPVCRFYGKGPNSHFFTAVAAECNFLKSLNPSNQLNDLSWFLENPAFFYVPNPTGSTCATGQQAVTRFYNNRGTNTGVNDANHRFVVSSTVAATMAAQGWVNEGVVFCAQPTSTTPPNPTPPTTGNGDCLPTLAVGDTFTTKYTDVDSGQVFNVPQVILAGETYRGQAANYVIASLDATGKVSGKTFYIDNASERRLLGSRAADGAENYYNPNYVLPKAYTVGQAVAYDHTEYSTADATLKLRKKGTVTLLSRESVTVPAGTFSNVCKMSSVGTVTGVGGGNITVDATFSGVAWSGGPFDQIKATAKTTLSAFGFTLDTNSLVELVSGKTGGKTYP